MVYSEYVKGEECALCTYLTVVIQLVPPLLSNRPDLATTQ